MLNDDAGAKSTDNFPRIHQKQKYCFIHQTAIHQAVKRCFAKIKQFVSMLISFQSEKRDRNGSKTENFISMK